jgi:transposase
LKEVWQHSAQQMQLKELVHSYESLMADSTRVKNRLKAIFRSQAIRYSGTEVYQVEKRADWLAKLTAPGLNFRAQTLFSELDTIGELGCQTRQKMLRQAGQHEDFQRLREIPGLGPINVSRLLAQVGTPFRFPNKRAFWKYCGFAVKTFSSADHRVLNGHIQKRRRAPQTRGLNQDFCRRLKDVFKTAAQKTAYREPFCQYYENLLKQGTKPSLAQVSLARKIAATTLSIWKNQTRFEKCRVAATS